MHISRDKYFLLYWVCAASGVGQAQRGPAATAGELRLSLTSLNRQKNYLSKTLVNIYTPISKFTKYCAYQLHLHCSGLGLL